MSGTACAKGYGSYRMKWLGLSQARCLGDPVLPAACRAASAYPIPADVELALQAAVAVGADRQGGRTGFSNGLHGVGTRKCRETSGAAEVAVKYC